MSPGSQFHVRPAQRRAQEGVSAGRPAALVGVDLIDADAFPGRGVEVGGGGQAQSPGRLDELLAKRMGARAQVRHVDRPPGSVVDAGAPVVILRHPEIGQNVGVGPAGIALGHPVVEVTRLAAHIDHGVDRAGAADHLAAGPVAGPATQRGDRRGVVHPVDLRIEEGAAIADGQLDPHRAVRAARFQHQHGRVRPFRQAPRDHAAGRAGADDQIVEGLRHRTGCWVISRCSIAPV